MQKSIILILLYFYSFLILAQTEIPKQTQNGFFKSDYFMTEMPDGEKNLGLAGIHYNLKLNDWSYAGAGLYGAVSGIRGGFFTLGIQAGIKKNIFSNIYFDTGIHFGGGGGAGAPEGGGAYILPHFNLGYQFSKFSIEGGYNYINFFDEGNIEGHQVNLAVSIPVSFDYTDFNDRGKDLIVDKNLSDQQWYQKSNTLSLLLHFNNLDLMKDTKDKDSGESLGDRTVNTVGFELNSYFKKNTFLFLKADGAYNGIPSGYMDIVFGLGQQFSFNKDRTRILGKFGIGAAGGGGIDTGGGFILYPDISFEQKIFKDIFISLNKGYLWSPDSDFSASSYGFGIKKYFYQNGMRSSEEDVFSLGIFKGLEFILGQEIYLNAARNNEIPERDLQQILLQINYYLNRNLYLSGQTSFANFGNAGAYAEGIVGLGISTSENFSENIQLFAQSLFGAAGGGHVDTGEGLIVKPSIGASLLLNDKLGARASFGQVIAIDGELNSTMFNVGLTYRIATLFAK